MGDMERVFGGRRHERPEYHAAGRVFEGRIHSLDLAGAYFVPEGGSFKFGPCPYPLAAVETASVGDHGSHDHGGTLPIVGHRCLVQSYFTAAGIEKFWIIATWPV